MIERSEFIESVTTWYKRPLATSNDIILAAFVTLRLAAVDTIEAYSPQHPVSPARLPSDSLLATINPLVEAWKKHWLSICSEQGSYSSRFNLPQLATHSLLERCHPFLISFFGTHILLLLYSFPLQESMSSPIGPSVVDTEAFWITYTSAMDMLKLVSNPSLSPLLGFAHDSIHVMTAYAAVFLIKVMRNPLSVPCSINWPNQVALSHQLLLSVKSVTRNEFETATIDTINTAARVFEQQSAPPTYTCSRQASFLRNVVQEYKRSCRWQHSRNVRDDQEGDTSLYQQTMALPVVQQNMQAESTVHQISHLPQEADASSGGGQYYRDEASSAYQNPANNAGVASSATADHLTPMANDIVDQIEPHNWEFTGEDWTSLFMNAGFDIVDGVFVPM